MGSPAFPVFDVVFPEEVWLTTFTIARQQKDNKRMTHRIYVIPLGKHHS